MNAILRVKCQLCTVKLDPGSKHDDLEHRLCSDCRTRPEARRLLGTVKPIAVSSPTPRSFTAAEKALIRRVHGYMPASQLLEILNERLVSDLGDKAAPYAMEQLHAEIQQLTPPAGAGDWAGLRKLLARARQDGVLRSIDAQRIDDFAVVFSLTSAQVLRVKDVVLTAKETAK